MSRGDARASSGLPLFKYVVANPMGLEARRASIYPGDLANGFERRAKRALTDALGLTQFGVNLTTLEPGAMSSLRHWHANEDECVYVIAGAVTLVTDEGETELTAGMLAGFPAGNPNGHHLVNRGGASAQYLEIGTRSPQEEVTYPDADLKIVKIAGVYHMFRKSGEPY
ncbi:MAG: cupin domain-containing protein [Hyphomicrobium sp.]